MTLEIEENGQEEHEEQNTSELEGVIIDNRYRVIRYMGAGSVGELYRAELIRLKKEFALKVLRPSFAASLEQRLRFQREAHVLATLSHPNIISINDYGMFDKTPFLVMELLSGETLYTTVGNGPLKPSQAFEIIRQVLQALIFAHKQGLIHRDLKPENIFLQHLARGAIHVTILDFGLAKFISPSGNTDGPQLTLTGKVFGTPAYMAPEQVMSSKHIDARTDLYALGAILFEMLSGRFVFAGNSVQEILQKHLRTPPPTLEEACPERRASPGLESFFKRALAKERGDRFENAEEMLDYIEDLKQPAVQILPPILNKVDYVSSEACSDIRAQNIQPIEKTERQKSLWNKATGIFKKIMN